MTPYNQCEDDCEYYLWGRTCLAFKDAGIPLDIMYGRVIHDHPIEGDSGLMYSPKSERHKMPRFELIDKVIDK